VQLNLLLEIFTRMSKNGLLKKGFPNKWFV
jgi:hypothetical protein